MAVQWHAAAVLALLLVACNALSGLSGLEFNAAGGAAGDAAGGIAGVGGDAGGNGATGGGATGGNGATGGGGATGGSGGSAGCTNFALSFDGVDDMVEVPYSDTLNMPTSFTIEAWIYPTAAGPTEGHVLSHHHPFDLLGYTLLINDGALEVRFYDGSTTFSANAGPIGTDQWAHVAGVYDGAWLRVFVDGAQQDIVNVGAMGPASCAEPLRIGGAAYGSDFRFAGLIDEVRLSNGAVYTVDFTRPIAPFDLDPTTVALWRFDGVGQLVSDETSVHDGTLGATQLIENDDPARSAAPCIADM